MKASLSLIFFFCAFICNAQTFHTLRGYVYSEENKVLPGANLRVFDSKTGTQTNALGQYEIKLEEGLHRLSFSYIGYTSETFEMVVNQDEVRNIFLSPDTSMLLEVVVNVKKKDYSYEAIRNVIENKELFLQQYSNYACKTYIKALEEPINIKTPKPKKEKN